MQFIKEWSRLFLVETLFWAAFVSAIFFAPDWYRYKMQMLSLYEASTLFFAIVGYGLIGSWAKKLFINSYTKKRISSYKHLSDDDIKQEIKIKLESEPSVILFIFVCLGAFFIFAWTYQNFYL